jgi:hypothetical protein
MFKKQIKETARLDFEGQRSDEKVLFVFRRHMIAMRKGFYLLLVPFCLLSLPYLIWPENFDLLWLAVFGFVVGLLMFFYHFIMWYFTVYIVTNQRMRQITQKGFFGKDVIELRLAKVQNISYNIPGFSGEIFHFGTIVIQTFVGDLVIKNVENPHEIYNKLQDAVSDAVEAGGGEYEKDII